MPTNRVYFIKKLAINKYSKYITSLNKKGE